MAQFDVYQNPNPDTVRVFPYLIDVQADLLCKLPTRVVVPLVSVSMLNKTTPELNPQLEIEGVKVLMLTAQIAGVAVSSLETKVCSLKDRRSDILAALDFLFVGY
ncbi:MAG: plasmid maintenance protein CcdB [Geobacteraceae bacterium GWC2_58_44]|nr:MAG: plasmid maintenance protein CcdB [Geobacteraceae bacterium GWC2_58_44]